MPELPEVETVRRTLAPHVIGATVARTRLVRRDVCESWTCSPKGLRRSGATAVGFLEGAHIAAIHRHGKHLAIIAEDGRALGVHLGMTGSLGWASSLPAVLKHVHAWWELGDAGFMYFEDARRFGGLQSYPSFADLKQHRWRELGTDAMSVNAGELFEGLQATRRSIKAALLDQGVLAGLGNIYVDESLFAAGIHPLRAACEVPCDRVVRLTKVILEVLNSALAKGGSTLRDYRDADGKRGTFQSLHAVYGRAGQACIRCGSPLQSQRISQRMSVWCPTCQPI
ncbi:Formamidopyrimidine-DNA glycosylase [Phycisphaerales bacterium]|nr:Formamidopyrimidine-DNA glycosylase [Phycisphaerales bacterium]